MKIKCCCWSDVRDRILDPRQNCSMKIRSLKQLLLIIMRSVLAWKTPLNLENLEMLNIEAVVVKATCVTCASLWDSHGLGSGGDGGGRPTAHAVIYRPSLCNTQIPGEYRINCISLLILSILRAWGVWW